MQIRRVECSSANMVLHTVGLTRMRYHAATRAHVERRTSEGLSTKDLVRSL
jgi:hypothetical protein